MSVPRSVDQGDLAVSFAHLIRDDFTCGVLVFDRNHRLVHFSRNIPQLLHLDAEKLIGSDAAALPGRVGKLVRHVAQSSGATSQTEFLERTGRPGQNLRLTALPLLDAGDSGFIAILVQDLNRAQRLENDIRQLDRLASIGTLAAEMAHEVKNAMVAVNTFVDLLLEQNSGAELAGTVRREMGRINSIVSQVLKFSRNPAPALQPVSLHAVIDHSLKMIQPRLDGQNVTIISRLTAAPDIVQGCEAHLEQAVLNLLFNAAEAMNGEGTLTLESDFMTNPAPGSAEYVSDRQLRVVIRDTGHGISSENMAHLFEPFFTTKRNGTGLGLAITRRIIHEHHGLISAESLPGKGTTFHILLPAA